eukprot:m.1088047 g.1088047  ORF g.1088047 m.1088047 type:complete len:1127 (-) comp24286_c0_seq4:1467-4847(-)
MSVASTPSRKPMQSSGYDRPENVIAKKLHAPASVAGSTAEPFPYPQGLKWLQDVEQALAVRLQQDPADSKLNTISPSSATETSNRNKMISAVDCANNQQISSRVASLERALCKKTREASAMLAQTAELHAANVALASQCDNLTRQLSEAEKVYRSPSQQGPEPGASEGAASETQLSTEVSSAQPLACRSEGANTPDRTRRQIEEKDAQLKALVRLVLDLRKQLEAGDAGHSHVSANATAEIEHTSSQHPPTRALLASEQRMRMHAESALAATSRQLAGLQAECRELRATVARYASHAQLPAGETAVERIICHTENSVSQCHSYSRNLSQNLHPTALSSRLDFDSCTTLDSGVGLSRAQTRAGTLEQYGQIDDLIATNETLRRELELSTRIVHQLHGELSAQSSLTAALMAENRRVCGTAQASSDALRTLERLQQLDPRTPAHHVADGPRGASLCSPVASSTMLMHTTTTTTRAFTGPHRPLAEELTIARRTAQQAQADLEQLQHTSEEHRIRATLLAEENTTLVTTKRRLERLVRDLYDRIESLSQDALERVRQRAVLTQDTAAQTTPICVTVHAACTQTPQCSTSSTPTQTPIVEARPPNAISTATQTALVEPATHAPTPAPTPRTVSGKGSPRAFACTATAATQTSASVDLLGTCVVTRDVDTQVSGSTMVSAPVEDVSSLRDCVRRAESTSTATPPLERPATSADEWIDTGRNAGGARDRRTGAMSSPLSSLIVAEENPSEYQHRHAGPVHRWWAPEVDGVVHPRAADAACSNAAATTRCSVHAELAFVKTILAELEFEITTVAMSLGCDAEGEIVDVLRNLLHFVRVAVCESEETLSAARDELSTQIQAQSSFQEQNDKILAELRAIEACHRKHASKSPSMSPKRTTQKVSVSTSPLLSPPAGNAPAAVRSSTPIAGSWIHATRNSFGEPCTGQTQSHTPSVISALSPVATHSATPESSTVTTSVVASDQSTFSSAVTLSSTPEQFSVVTSERASKSGDTLSSSVEPSSIATGRHENTVARQRHRLRKKQLKWLRLRLASVLMENRDIRKVAATFEPIVRELQASLLQSQAMYRTCRAKLATFIDVETDLLTPRRAQAVQSVLADISTAVYSFSSPAHESQS